MRDCPYFIYSGHNTLAKAESALEDYFATDQVSESEQPYIDGPHRNQVCANGVVRWVYRYNVMFPMS